MLVWRSRIPHRISKILFALGANEFLEMLEGKIKVQSGKITVCTVGSYFSHTVVRREQFGWMRQISVEKLDEDGKSRCTARENFLLKEDSQKIIKSLKGTYFAQSF